MLIHGEGAVGLVHAEMQLAVLMIKLYPVVGQAGEGAAVGGLEGAGFFMAFVGA
jgi:hypothetical protein